MSFDNMAGDLLDLWGPGHQRGVYVSERENSGFIVPLLQNGGLFQFVMTFKLDGLGGTIFHTRRVFNNAWYRYSRYECFPYNDCFDTEKWGDIEIWQTPCGDVVFDMPGFHHKFEAEIFREGEWNAVMIQVYPGGHQLEANFSKKYHVNARVWLNEYFKAIEIEDGWVPSVVNTEVWDTPSSQFFSNHKFGAWSLGGYALWDNLNFRDEKLTTEYQFSANTIHKAPGWFNWAHYDN